MCEGDPTERQSSYNAKQWSSGIVFFISFPVLWLFIQSGTHLMLCSVGISTFGRLKKKEIWCVAKLAVFAD